MGAFLLILILIIICGVQICASGCFNDEYMSKKYTTAINGIFVIMVVFSHYVQYADFTGLIDKPYMIVREHLNQMIVASFMFYSGYGMEEAIKRKGAHYIQRLPGKFMKLLIRFDCAVLLFLILNMCIGNQYSSYDIALAFTSWTSIGNSNWYITAILMLYISMFFSFSLGMSVLKDNKGRAAGVAILFLLTMAVVLAQIKIGRPKYCYNTMILFPLGCLFSEVRQNLEKYIKYSDVTYVATVLIVTVLYIWSFKRRSDYGIEMYSVWACSFTALLILITMKIRIYNRALEWFGSHVFSIYILQRIPMIILDQFGLIDSHKYASLAAVFVLTIPIAIIFEKVTDKLLGGGANGKNKLHNIGHNTGI